MKTIPKARTLVDLERLNTLDPEGCPACGRNFELGESIVLACGNWEGERYIHEDEAVYDKKTRAYFERSYYKDSVPH